MKTKYKVILFFCLVGWLIGPRTFAEEESPGNFKNPIAVQEVLAGKRTTANAAWWGFDKGDSTAALQGAINSGASKVIVPYMGSDWIVRPIKLDTRSEIWNYRSCMRQFDFEFHCTCANGRNSVNIYLAKVPADSVDGPRIIAGLGNIL